MDYQIMNDHKHKRTLLEKYIMRARSLSLYCMLLMTTVGYSATSDTDTPKNTATDNGFIWKSEVPED
jgi:hypothetical protein